MPQAAFELRNQAKQTFAYQILAPESEKPEGSRIDVYNGKMLIAKNK
jgi:hypothetical protein